MSVLLTRSALWTRGFTLKTLCDVMSTCSLEFAWQTVSWGLWSQSSGPPCVSDAKPLLRKTGTHVWYFQRRSWCRRLSHTSARMGDACAVDGCANAIRIFVAPAASFMKDFDVVALLSSCVAAVVETVL